MTVPEYVQVASQLAQIMALAAAGVWAYYLRKEHRESMRWVEFHVSARLFKLNSPIKTQANTWLQDGKCSERLLDPATHAVEVYLKFTNRGKTQLKLFNVQVAILTMRAAAETKFDKDTGHLSLRRLTTSGNVVPPMPVAHEPLEKSSYYYVEPGVTQTVSFLTLIAQPNEILQVVGYFGLEQSRLFPRRLRTEAGLYPHSSARTYKIDSNGNQVNV